MRKSRRAPKLHANPASTIVFDNVTPVLIASSHENQDRSHYATQTPLVKRSKKSPYALRSPLSSTVRETSEHTLQSDAASNDAHSKQSANVELFSDSDTFFGLPSKVRELLKENRGIEKLFDWQCECLTLPSLKQSKNLIYSLPTSGGKTLVAEILVLQQLLLHQKDVICIFPFVSIVQEKVQQLIPFANELDFIVEEYAGSRGQIPPKNRRKNTVFIGTIEKIHILVNSLIEMHALNKIGLVVIDELHMVGERGGRGCNLEFLITKIRHCSPITQLVGMSATLSNINDLAQFMDAEVYTNSFRPVKLTEFVKLSDDIYEYHHGEENPFIFNRKVSFGYSQQQVFKDPDHIVGLVSEVIPDFSCLVFCQSKKNCENVCLMICNFMPSSLKSVKYEQRQALLEELESDADGKLCEVLRKCIPFGVAYHHSGLTMDERKAIEDAYLRGTICLLCCTSTLAAGVNLPAKRVIVRSPYVGASFISKTQYKQMIGRAGRTGFGVPGESFLIINKPNDKNKVESLLSETVEKCSSNLLDVGSTGLKNMILSVVGLKVCTSLSDLKDFMKLTLAAVQNKGCCNLEEHLNELVVIGLIQTKDEDEFEEPQFEVTSLGAACYKSSVPLDAVKFVYEELRDASTHLVVSSHLHLLYLCVPREIALDFTPDWNTYLKNFGSLDGRCLEVASMLGVSEQMLVQKSTGLLKRARSTEMDYVLSKFYLSLMLYELMKPTNIWLVSDIFSVTRGVTQNLLSSASSFCFHLVKFTECLSEFWALHELFSKLQGRLNFTVNQDLVPLMEIPKVKYGRAKQLLNAGYKNLTLIANADAAAMSSAIDKLPLVVAREIINGARFILTERLDSLKDEIEELSKIPSFKTLNETLSGSPVI